MLHYRMGKDLYELDTALSHQGGRSRPPRQMNTILSPTGIYDRRPMGNCQTCSTDVTGNLDKTYFFQFFELSRLPRS